MKTLVVAASADPASKGSSEFQYPQPNGFIANVYAALGQQIFNIPVAHRKTVVESDGLPDNIGMEAVASV